MRTFVIILSAVCMLSVSSCATRVVARPGTTVTVVKTPPKNYKIVKVNGKRYYFWNGTHYKKTRRGYVVVRV